MGGHEQACVWAFGAVGDCVGCCELLHFAPAATLESTARSNSEVAASASERRYLWVCRGASSDPRRMVRLAVRHLPRLLGGMA